MARELSRRRFLWLAGGLPVVAACSDDRSPSEATGGAVSTTDGAATVTSSASPTQTSTESGSREPADAEAAGGAAPELTGADFDGLGTCGLFPSSTAGPFPLDQQLVRRDITEGYPGHPLHLGLRVVDEQCVPVPFAEVEIWHTDHTGDYSAFADGGDGKDEADGTTFMRGTQQAAADGIVQFDTIYPGWYPGRAVHIHLYVRVEGERVLTGQLYFPEDDTARVFAQAPYSEFGQPDTTHATDGISGDPAAEGSMLTLRPSSTRNGHGTLALANLGVGV